MELRKIEIIDEFGFKEIYNIDEQGRRQGKYIELYPNGTLSCKCNFKNDKKHGRETEYGENGKIISICDYIEGKRHGSEVVFDKYDRLVLANYYQYNELVRRIK